MFSLSLSLSLSLKVAPGEEAGTARQVEVADAPAGGAVAGDGLAVQVDQNQKLHFPLNDDSLEQRLREVNGPEFHSTTPYRKSLL